MKKTILSAAIALPLAFAFTSCEKTTTIETTEEKVSADADKAAESIKEATEDAADASKEAAEEVKDAAQDAAGAVKEAAEEVKEEVVAPE